MIKQKNGFTMVDVLVVISIMFIFSTIAITRITSYNTVKLFSVANKLAMDIRYTQQLGISKQKHCGISFDPGNESYFVYIQNTTNKATDPFTRGDLIVNYQTDPYYKGVDLVGTNFGNKLIFDQVGKPLDSAEVALASDGQVILQSQGESMAISITLDTGRISIQ
jgi:type II secretory pathway pseudopilin PulG